MPGFILTNTCKQGRYIIEKLILTDPLAPCAVAEDRFEQRKARSADYHLYVLLAPHLEDRGEGNTARVDEFKGIPMLMAEREGFGLALACSAPRLHRSAGYVGVSDGWQDLLAHQRMTWEYDAAEDGNVALIGEIDLSAGEESSWLSASVATSPRRRIAPEQASIKGSKARECYERNWTDWQKSLRTLASPPNGKSAAYRVSTAVLATHESKDFQGGTIASLSVPWGEIHGDKDKAGYHLVWPRDAYETASPCLRPVRQRK